MRMCNILNSWRKSLLDDLITGISKITLVFDPDSLLKDELLVRELFNRGFELIELEDTIEFRYIFESRYRKTLEADNYKELIIITKFSKSESSNIPFDILEKSRQIAVSLSGIFPNLSYPILAELDYNLLDDVYEAQIKKKVDRLGLNATKDFILREVFNFEADQPFSEVDLLQYLLNLHYKGKSIPSTLVERMITSLQRTHDLRELNLFELITSSNAFYEFILERWELFVQRKVLSKSTNEDDSSLRYDNLKYQGLYNIPFQNQSLKLYIDTMFMDGVLTPIVLSEDDVEQIQEKWILSGVTCSEADGSYKKLLGIFNALEEVDFSSLNLHKEWVEYATTWAEASAICHNYSSELSHETKLQYNTLRAKINFSFAVWLRHNFDSLITLPPSNPVMLHHVPKRMARDVDVNASNRRLALVVIDGLSLDQWFTVRKYIKSALTDCRINESAVFAWVPTVTSVSRQTIFSGELPRNFANSINRTNKEEHYWQKFWQDTGFKKHNIKYNRSLGKGDAKEDLDEIITHTDTKVVGLVINTIDDIMHGMELGASGMHTMIHHWCESGYLVDMLEHLTSQGFDVWITSDHGNMESIGRGRPSEGVIAESKGERVRVYPTPELRSKIQSEFDFSLEWDSSGLPSDYYPLVTQNNDAFIKEGDTVVGHGGIAIEEVIVPLINISRLNNE